MDHMNIKESVDILDKATRGAREMLDSALADLRGPLPPSPKSPTNGPMPGGVHGQLAQIHQVMSDMHSQLHELRSIVGVNNGCIEASPSVGYNTLKRP